MSGWLPLTLLCALALAAADALTKHLLPGRGGWELVLVRIGGPALLLAPLLWVWPVPAGLPPAFWGWMALSVPLELGAMWVYMVAIRDAPLYLTLPYLAFTPVFNVLTAWVLLGETVSTRGLAGIWLVVLGAWWLNADQRGEGLRGLLRPLAAILRIRASRWMLGIAFVYSLTSVISKKALGHYPDPRGFGALYYALIGGVLLSTFALARPRALRVFVERPRASLVIGGLMAVMVVTHFMAIAQVEVAYMIAVKRTSLVFGILLGWWLFHEAAVARHAAAGAVMVAGVALILI